MSAITRILLMLSLIGAAVSLMKTEYGAVYDHFKENSLEFTEEDLHLLADAFYINNHFSQAQQVGLLTDIQSTIANATNQTVQIGNLIDSTSALIKVVKDATNQISNPGNAISKALKGGLKSLFGRVLQNKGSSSVTQFVSNLENKVAEAKANQQSITNSLSNSVKFLGALQGVEQLLKGNTTGFKSTIKSYFGSWLGAKRVLGDDGLIQDHHQVDWNSMKGWLGDQLKNYKGQNNVTQTSDAPSPKPASTGLLAKMSNLFQNAAAHLEHLAEKPDAGYGRHRKSLFQQKQESGRLLKMASSAKNAAVYLSTANQHDLSFEKLENHMWDLVQEGGATGKAYLRGVETLKCILLHQNCPQNTEATVEVSQVLPTQPPTIVSSEPAKIVYFGQDANSASSAAESQGNVFVQTGTSNQVQAAPLKNGVNGQIQDNQARVNPGILTGQTWNIDSISQTNGFNPSQGNEAVIIQNESKVNQLPPVSDLVPGVKYTTVINQPTNAVANNDFSISGINAAVKSSTISVVSPNLNNGQNSSATKVTVVNSNSGVENQNGAHLQGSLDVNSGNLVDLPIRIPTGSNGISLEGIPNPAFGNSSSYLGENNDEIASLDSKYANPVESS